MSRSGSSLDWSSHLFEISDSSQIGEARRYAQQLARNADFDETSTGRAAIVINELSSNLLKHAQRGEILVQLNGSSACPRLEILSLDRGPGIPDLARSFEDGFSTAATAGTGLGAVRRLSDFSDFYTDDKGTGVLSVIQNHRDQIQDPSFYMGGVCLPLRSEAVSGDAWTFRRTGERPAALLADGLGHGFLAHEAARAAIESFQEAAAPEDLDRLLQAIHFHLKSTRGAAVALATLDPQKKEVEFLSIGNVRAVVLTPAKSTSLLSHAGTLGLQYRSAKSQVVPFSKEARLVMFSDGLHQRWDLSSYPGLFLRHPALIAGLLYRDFARGTDDVTVLVGGWLA